MDRMDRILDLRMGILTPMGRREGILDFGGGMGLIWRVGGYRL